MPGLQPFASAELPHHRCSVLMLGVDGVVEAPDVGGGEFAGEIRQRGAELRKLRENGLADDGHGIVRWKVVAVVGECNEAKCIDEAIGGISSDNVHLMVDERAVDEAQVHHFGRFGKVEIVASAEAGEAIGTLEKFVADTGAPLGGERGNI